MSVSRNVFTFTMFDSERLIIEIEARPCLWDFTKTLCYGNRELRKQAWEEIAAILYPDLNKTEESERACRIEDIQRKWRNIRDYYKKIKSQPEENRKKYIYYDLLRFLDKTLKRRITVPIFNDGDMTEESGNFDDTESSQNGDHFMHQKIKFAQNGFFNMAENQIEMDLQQRHEEIDEDKAFLLSLLPSLKKMDPQHKLDFKIQTLQTLKNIMFNSESSPPCQSSE